MDTLSGTPNLQKLLPRYVEAGGVVEHTIFERGFLIPGDIATHRQAALNTLEAIRRQAEQAYERERQWRLARRQSGKSRTVLPDLPLIFEGDTIRTDLLIGHEIGLAEFLGKSFPFLCEQHILPEEGAKETFLNRYAELLALTEALPLTDPSTPDDLDFDKRGYAYTFLDAPHGIDMPYAQLAALFFSVSDELFCGFHCPLTIFQWSTNCSNYFDAGHEWWGSFFWTVEPVEADYIVSIVASSTD